jgi:hypothetical protein
LSARGDARQTRRSGDGDEIIHRLTQSLERDEKQKLSDRLKAQGDRLAKFEGEIAAIVEQLKRHND